MPGAGEPPLTLTGPNLLTAEGAELGFCFHELALQGNTLTEETSWKGVCGLGPLSAGEGESWALRSEGGRGRAWTPGVE